ncbi:unnamed protein product [Cochlearia groenlandica]
MAVMDCCPKAKRAKRTKRVSADLYDFSTFPAENICGGGGVSTFRDRVRSFLSSHARVTFPTSTLFSSLMTWQILLRHGDPTDLASRRIVYLDVVEEDVTRSSRSVYCDHCRVVGWSSHPVCRKRYHFIIRSRGGDSKSINIGMQKSCSKCGNAQSFSEGGVCKICSLSLDIDDWVYSQLEDNTHLLHGVIHSNGYAHLLSVNGREGGSGFLTGRAVMGFWDRLCLSLAVRKASVMDVSRKYGMDYRLLHGVTRGCSWYSEWGYEFKSGSYALTREVYDVAVNTLSAIPLSEFLFQGRKPRTQLHSTIGLYQSLSCSELVTIRDLLLFMVQLIHESRSKPIAKPSVLCAWSRTDVERVHQALVKILKASGDQQSKWVKRWALKRSICRTASPQLIDYCLKHFGGVLSDDGSRVVFSRCNPGSNDFEYRLEPVNNVHSLSNQDINYATEEQIKRDLRYLYDALLHPQTMAEFKSHATRDKMVDAATKLLDCKHFIKDYLSSTVNPFAISLWCHVELSDQSKECPSPPPELLVLPLTATVSDLKIEAAKAFQEVYAMFKRLEVDEVLGYGFIDDSITLKLLVGTNGAIRVKGRCSSKHGLLRYRMERGVENWKVDCKCGTKDDDGERMLACDVCGVWHHTRCAGINNPDALPAKFHCFRCNDLYRKRPKLSENKGGSSQVPKAALACRGESAAMGSGSNLSLTLSVG